LPFSTWHMTASCSEHRLYPRLTKKLLTSALLTPDRLRRDAGHFLSARFRPWKYCLIRQNTFPFPATSCRLNCTPPNVTAPIAGTIFAWVNVHGIDPIPRDQRLMFGIFATEPFAYAMAHISKLWEWINISLLAIECQAHCNSLLHSKWVVSSFSVLLLSPAQL
jgi:hypothetical protein